MSAAQNAGLRTVGVEEELLIADPAEGRPLPLAGELLAFSRTPVAPRLQPAAQAWPLWPTAGPAELFGSAGYRS